jgi:hypothetical protein
MTTTRTDSRPCHRCGHAYDEHSAGITGRCVHGVCECPWFQIYPTLGTLPPGALPGFQVRS